MIADPERLKKFLLDAELITEIDFKKAMEKSKQTNRRIGQVLIDEKIIEPEKLVKFEAYLSGIPFVNIEKEKILPEVLNIIPEQVARKNNVIAFRKSGDNLEVAMLNPEDLATIEFIKKADHSLKILPRLTTMAGIKSATSQYQSKLDIELKGIIKGDLGDISHIPIRDKTIDENGNEDLKKAAEELPIIKIIDTLLKHAILQSASDIHIEPLEKEVLVRFRIDGILEDIMNLPGYASSGIVARIKVLSNLKLDEHRLPQDGRFKIETDDYKYSVRVSVLPVSNGEKIVMRMLSESAEAQTLEDLGFIGKYLEIVNNNLRKTTGMILITGPTGSGKTTTLYAMMKILNTAKVNISTIEDPIEYRMPRINQTQVNSQIGLTFASGLRALVRQDPNIIMVGEIRDGETVDLAINAALTGHLVLSTLHTNSAGGTIPRMIDMGAEPFLISSTVNLIVAQRLVRKFAGSKEKYRLKDSDLKNLAKYCDLKRITEILKREGLMKAKEDLSSIYFYKPKPSKDYLSGYKGRIGIFEVLAVNNTIKELISSKTSAEGIEERAIQNGMITMIEDGFIKAAKGITSIEEVLRVIVE